MWGWNDGVSKENLGPLPLRVEKPAPSRPGPDPDPALTEGDLVEYRARIEIMHLHHVEAGSGECPLHGLQYVRVFGWGKNATWTCDSCFAIAAALQVTMRRTKGRLLLQARRRPRQGGSNQNAEDCIGRCCPAREPKGEGLR